MTISNCVEITGLTYRIPTIVAIRRPHEADPLESAAAVSLHVAEPTSPPSAAHQAAHLRFGCSGMNTVLERSFAPNPLKVLTTRSVSRVCWVCTATYGGGIVGGDEIRLNVEVGPGARAVIITQASTKVYRSLRPACQHVMTSIDADGLLVMVPDPVVCFAGGHFSQRQRYDLDPRANLVMIDWMTSGRHGTGERWEFQHYSSGIDIRVGGQRILYDTLVLDGADGAVSERLSRFEVCLTAVIVGPLVASAAAAIVHALSARAVEKGSDLVEAAWPLPGGGTLLRMSGVSVEQVGAALRTRLSFICDLIAEDPWSRKW
jgi:urease accessory protein